MSWGILSDFPGGQEWCTEFEAYQRLKEMTVEIWTFLSNTEVLTNSFLPSLSVLLTSDPWVIAFHSLVFRWNKSIFSISRVGAGEMSTNTFGKLLLKSTIMAFSLFSSQIVVYIFLTGTEYHRVTEDSHGCCLKMFIEAYFLNWIPIEMLPDYT